MRKSTGLILLATALLLVSGCVPRIFRVGVDYDDYPDRDLPLYDDAIVFDYEEDDDEVEIVFGTQDDVDDVMEFYQEYFTEESILILQEETKRDEYQVEGIIDDFLFSIEVEEADGKPARYFDTLVEVEIEYLDDDKLARLTNQTKPLVDDTQPPVDTPYITRVTLAEDVDEDTLAPIRPVDRYAADAVSLYLTADIIGAVPDETTLTIQWILLDGNTLLNEHAIIASETDQSVYFWLTRETDDLWPIGAYEVRLLIDGDAAYTLPFMIDEMAVDNETAGSIGVTANDLLDKMLYLVRTQNEFSHLTRIYQQPEYTATSYNSPVFQFFLIDKDSVPGGNVMLVMIEQADSPYLIQASVSYIFQQEVPDVKELVEEYSMLLSTAYVMAVENMDEYNDNVRILVRKLNMDYTYLDGRVMLTLPEMDAIGAYSIQVVPEG